METSELLFNITFYLIALILWILLLLALRWYAKWLLSLARDYRERTGWGMSQEKGASKRAVAMRDSFSLVGIGGTLIVLEKGVHNGYFATIHLWPLAVFSLLMILPIYMFSRTFLVDEFPDKDP